MPTFVGNLETPNLPKVLSLDAFFGITAALDVPSHKFLIFENV